MLNAECKIWNECLKMKKDLTAWAKSLYIWIKRFN